MKGRGRGRPKVTGLSPQQREIALLRLQGKSYQECASVLGTSYLAVKKHIEYIYVYLGVHTLEELYGKMLELGELEERSA